MGRVGICWGSEIYKASAEWMHQSTNTKHTEIWMSVTLNTPVTFSSSYIVLPIHTTSRKFSLNLIIPDIICPETIFPNLQRFLEFNFPRHNLSWDNMYFLIYKDSLFFYSLLNILPEFSLSQNLKILVQYHTWTWYSLDSISQWDKIP